MNQKNVSRLSKALQLKREIIGLKYIYFEHEYSELDMQEYRKENQLLYDGTQSYGRDQAF